MVANAAQTSPLPKMANTAITKLNIRDAHSEPSRVGLIQFAVLFVELLMVLD